MDKRKRGRHGTPATAAHGAPMMDRLTISLAAFLAGAAGLLLELVWSRYLGLIFGVTAHAVGTVLACFMLGMGVGNIAADRLLRSQRWPAWQVLQMLLVLLAIVATLSPLEYAAAQFFGVRLIRMVGGAEAGASVTLVRGLVALGVLIVPTTLLGAIFPALVAVAKESASREAGVATIYGVNMLGAVAGALAAGFFLLPSVGLWRTGVIAGACCAVAAVLFRFRSAAMSKTAQPVPSPIATTPNDTVPPAAEWTALAVCIVSGCTSLAYQVLFNRILTLFFRDTVYDFSIVLATFLGGIALGGIASRPLLAHVRRAAGALGGVQLALCAAVLAGLCLFSRFPYWLGDMQTNRAVVERFGPDYWNAAIAFRVGYAALLIGVPAMLLGAAFPLAARIWMSGNPRRAIGTLTALNALGSTVGSLLAGFVLVPWLGMQHAILFMALLNLAAGITMLAACRTARIGWVWGGAGVVICITLFLFLPLWDRARMALGFLDPHTDMERFVELPFYREDATGLTAVAHLPALNQRYLVTNRLYSQNTSDLGGLEDHRRLGMIPLLLHPRAKKVLAIGLGAGITLRGIADLEPDVIDVAEISPAVVDAARTFHSENRDVLERPNVHVIALDGRGFLSAAEKKYDVIVLDILHPMSAGSSTVFSKEYYALCRDHLEPDGMLCQWLPVHQLSNESLRVILASFHSVFPHATVWYGLMGNSTQVIGIMGTMENHPPDFSAIQARYAALPAPARPELSAVELESPELLWSHYVMSATAAAKYCGQAVQETDDRPVVEFAAPKLAESATRQGMLNMVSITDAADGAASMGQPTEQKAVEKEIAAKREIVAGYRRTLIK